MSDDTENKFETQVLERLNSLSESFRSLSESVGKIRLDVDKLIIDSERFNERFSAYQQGTQWVVQLAFTLIASATITVVVTAVLRR
jgi:hypothetical protein